MIRERMKGLQIPPVAGAVGVSDYEEEPVSMQDFLDELESVVTFDEK